MSVDKEKKSDNKIAMQIISVFVAIVLWIIVGYTQDPDIDATIKDVSITYIGMDKLTSQGLTITHEEKPQTMVVSVQGKRSELLKAMNMVHAEVDVSEITNIGEYNMSAEIVIPVGNVQLTSQRTNSVNVTVEPIVTYNIPVRAVQSGGEKNSEVLVRSVPDVSEVEINGARSEVRSIADAVVKVDISDMHDANTQKYNIQLVDKTGTPVKLSPETSVGARDTFVTNTVYCKKSLPLKFKVGEVLDEMYAVSLRTSLPSEMTAGVISGMTVTELSAELSAEQFVEGTSEYAVKIDTPDGVYVPDENNNISVRAELVRRQAIAVNVPIALVNIPEGMNAVLDMPNIDINISAKPSELSADNVSAMVDLSGMSAGVHNINVEFTTKNSVNVLGQYTVRVTIG